jgi:hypothetical protein
LLVIESTENMRRQEVFRNAGCIAEEDAVCIRQQLRVRVALPTAEAKQRPQMVP